MINIWLVLNAVLIACVVGNVIWVKFQSCRETHTHRSYEMVPPTNAPNRIASPLKKCRNEDHDFVIINVSELM